MTKQLTQEDIKQLNDIRKEINCVIAEVSQINACGPFLMSLRSIDCCLTQLEMTLNKFQS